MINTAVAAALVVLTGLPLAFSMTRRVLFALVLAPVVTALTSTLAVILMLIIGGRLLYWYIPLVLAQFAIAAKLQFGPQFQRWQRRQGQSRGKRQGGKQWQRDPLPATGSRDIMWLTVPLMVPLLEILTPPTIWDAHSIWWMHAGYFTHGATFARGAMSNPALFFTHADYPPLASAPVAVVWSIVDGYSFRVAQLVSTIVTASAIALLAYAVREVTSRALPGVSRAAGIGVGLAAWYSAPWAVASGMSDPMWAAACVAGALLLLIGTGWLERPLLPVMLLTMAALAKNEGTTMTVIIVALITVRYRRTPAKVLPVWIPVAAGLFWMALSRVIGAVSDVTSALKLRELAAGDPEVLGRFPQAVDFLWAVNGRIIMIALATAILGTLFLRTCRSGMGLGSDLWLWIPAVAYSAALLLTYLIRTPDITWYLTTSAARVSLPVVLLASASAACWGVAATASQHRSMDIHRSFHSDELVGAGNEPGQRRP